MRRKKKNLQSLSSSFQVEEDVSFIIETEPEPLEIGSACSFSLNYDDKGIPLIHVKTYGNVDVSKLRQMILKRYPEARLKVLEMPAIALRKPPKPRRKKRKKSTKREKRKK